MNFYVIFDHKEAGTYVIKYLLPSCDWQITLLVRYLPLSLFFSVGEYQDSTLFDADSTSAKRVQCFPSW